MDKKPRILLVDDEPSIVKIVGKRLEVAGFEVRMAMDGQEGLEKAKTEEPDLIVLDLMLPKLNGYEVCSALKQDPIYQGIPIIMFSARTHEKDERTALQCGADAYMHKPFKSEDLVGRIRALIQPSPAAGRP